MDGSAIVWFVVAVVLLVGAVVLDRFLIRRRGSPTSAASHRNRKPDRTAIAVFGRYGWQQHSSRSCRSLPR